MNCLCWELNIFLQESSNDLGLFQEIFVIQAKLSSLGHFFFLVRCNQSSGQHASSFLQTTAAVHTSQRRTFHCPRASGDIQKENESNLWVLFSSNHFRNLFTHMQWNTKWPSADLEAYYFQSRPFLRVYCGLKPSWLFLTLASQKKIRFCLDLPCPSLKILYTEQTGTILGNSSFSSQGSLGFSVT